MGRAQSAAGDRPQAGAVLPLRRPVGHGGAPVLGPHPERVSRLRVALHFILRAHHPPGAVLPGRLHAEPAKLPDHARGLAPSGQKRGPDPPFPGDPLSASILPDRPERAQGRQAAAASLFLPRRPAASYPEAGFPAPEGLRARPGAPAGAGRGALQLPHVAGEHAHLPHLRPGLHPVLPAVRQGGVLRLRHGHGHAGLRALRVDLRRRQLHPAHLAPAGAAVRGHALFGGWRALLSRAHAAADLGLGAAHLPDPRHPSLYAVHLRRHVPDLCPEQLHRQHVVRDRRHIGLLRGGEGGGPAGAGEDVGDVPAL